MNWAMDWPFFQAIGICYNVRSLYKHKKQPRLSQMSGDIGTSNG